ncbi:EpsG family protein [bacterium]|nr:EpsG family protein [bacterium]
MEISVRGQEQMHPTAILNAPTADLRTRTSIDAALSVSAPVCVLIFLLINPFLALFILGVISLNFRVPVSVFVLSASVSFTLFFFFREYGIQWHHNSSDDIPQYVAMYVSNYSLSFTEIFTRFFDQPAGSEPFWHIPWWALLNWFNASDKTFILLHYFVIFGAQFLALATLSKRYVIPFAVVYFFLTPSVVDSMAHIWRQQLAFSMFLTGIGLYMNHGSSRGKWLMYGSALIHLSAGFFGVIFFIAEWFSKRGGFDNKLKVLSLLIVFLVGVSTFSSAVVFFLESIGVTRFMGYYEGDTGNVLRVYLIISVYAVPLLISFYFLRSDDINNLIMVLCFAVFSIVLAAPAANSLYDRLLMFVLPLWGLYFFRCLLLNFSTQWRGPVLIVVFVSGLLRLHAPTAEGFGVAQFLAFGNAFDPFMGIIKCLWVF